MPTHGYHRNPVTGTFMHGNPLCIKCNNLSHPNMQLRLAAHLQKHAVLAQESGTFWRIANLSTPEPLALKYGDQVVGFELSTLVFGVAET